MRRRRIKGQALKWCCLISLVVLIPLFLRTNTSAPPEDAVAIAMVSPAPTLSVALPESTVSPDPTMPLAQEPQPVATEAPSIPTTTPSKAPVEMSATPAPTTTPAPDSWYYSDDRVEVSITKHRQGSFVYFAADIRLTDPAQFSYAFSHERYDAHTEPLSDIATRHDPLLAINGDYYSFHPNGIIIRGGELFRKTKSSRHLLIVEASGDLRVMTDRSEKQGLVADRLMAEGVLHTFEFGPVLVEEGNPVKLNSAILRVGNGYLEPRTAIGQYGPLHYLVIVVDGRSDGYSDGCDLPTLQQLFVEYGVEVAFNLDGGGSTTLWFDGEVINQPSAGSERKVSDIVMFMR